MKKYYIALAAIILLLVVWGFARTSTVEYVAVVDDEVTQLESELLELQTKIENNELTPEEASIAKDKIVTRLNTIQTSIGASTQNDKLKSAQQATFLASLDKFKTLLVSFQETLATIDELSEKDTKRKGSGSKKSLVSDFVDTFTSVEDVVEDTVEEYVQETPIEELVDVTDESEDTSDETSEEIEQTDESLLDDSVADDAEPEEEVTPVEDTDATSTDETQPIN